MAPRRAESPPVDLREAVAAFAATLEAGKPLEAMERFYAEHVAVFENRELSRAGREACLAHERELLAKSSDPPRFRVVRTAVDEDDGVAFLEYVVRFTAPNGRPMRLEEVAVQTWERGKIVEERFYYEGFVDEGD